LCPELVVQHTSEDDIELFILGRLSAQASAGVAAHLVVCSACLDEYEASCDFIETLHRIFDPQSGPLVEIHQTTDGPITFHLRRNGQIWIATLRGAQLSSGTFAFSRAQAEHDMRATFQQLFPEHSCTAACFQHAQPISQIS
jgi:hypothetical protein